MTYACGYCVIYMPTSQPLSLRNIIPLPLPLLLSLTSLHVGCQTIRFSGPLSTRKPFQITSKKDQIDYVTISDIRNPYALPCFFRIFLCLIHSLIYFINMSSEFVIHLFLSYLPIFLLSFLTVTYSPSFSPLLKLSQTLASSLHAALLPTLSDPKRCVRLSNPPSPTPSLPPPLLPSHPPSFSSSLPHSTSPSLYLTHLRF